MTWREHIAGAGGLGLGFVTGGVRGAYYGYLGGRALARFTAKKDMARHVSGRAVRRHNKHSGSRRRQSIARTGIRSVSRRPVRRVAARRFSKKRAVGKEYYGGSTSTSTRHAAVRMKRNKGIDFKRHRKVKVSRRLRQAVKVINSGGKIHGYAVNTYYGYIGNQTGDIIGSTGINTFLACATGNSGSKTWWQGSLNQAGAMYAGNEFHFFSPARVLSSASQLWNRKAIARDYSITANNFSGATNRLTGAQLTQTDALRITARKQWVDFLLKNNSQREVRVVMYVCAPKQVFTGTFPVDEFAADEAIQNTDNVTVSAAIATYTHPYYDPRINKKFTQNWKVEERVIAMDPGQTVSQVVNGPTEMVYDYEKFYIDGTDETQRIHKSCSRIVMFSVMADLSFTSGPAGPMVGNFIATPTATISHPISVRHTTHAHLNMPELSGFIAGNTLVAGVPQTLNVQRRAYVYNDWTELPFAADVVARYDEENPITLENPVN